VGRGRSRLAFWDAVLEMEVWPSGIALQEVVSNHRKLRRLRVGVVSVAERHTD